MLLTAQAPPRYPRSLPGDPHTGGRAVGGWPRILWPPDAAPGWTLSMDPIKGSCLCGTVAFDVVGQPLKFLYCHCRSCRKSSGSVHAANLAFGGDAVRGIGGAPRVHRFRAGLGRIGGTQGQGGRLSRQAARGRGAPEGRRDSGLSEPGWRESAACVLSRIRCQWKDQPCRGGAARRAPSAGCWAPPGRR